MSLTNFVLPASDEGDIPTCIWNSTTGRLEGKEPFVRMDIIWGFISTTKTGDGYKIVILPLICCQIGIDLTPLKYAGEECSAWFT